MSDAANSWSPFDGVDLEWWENQATAGVVSATLGPTWGMAYGENAESARDPVVSDLREDLSRADGCDRSSFLGKMGICELQALSDNVVEYVGYVAPVATLAVGGVVLVAGVASVVILLQYTGAAPVLQETGAAFGKGIKKGAQKAFGGR